MRGAAEGRATAMPAVLPETARPALCTPLLGGAASVVATAAVFASGGSSLESLAWIGGVAVAAAAAGAAAAALGFVRAPAVGPAGAALALLLAGFVVWSGLSILWSIAPDRSWDAVNRGLVYLSLLALGMLVGGVVREAPRLAAAGLAALIGLAVLWALAGKVVPALGPDVDRIARLQSPVGYWNALALLIAMSLPLWLWLGTRASHPPVLRAAAAPLLVLSIAALLLTTSRGGILVALVGVAVWFALDRARLEAGLFLLLAAPLGLAAGLLGLGLDGVAEAGAGGSDRTRDGALLGVALVLVALASAGLALAALRVRFAPDPRRVLAAAAILVAAGLVAGLVRVGNPVDWAEARLDEFRNPPSVQVQNDPTRLGQLSSNHRWTWWVDAWRIFEARPVRGAGAGAYELARRPLREDTNAPVDPHDLGLKALSETGLVGFALLLGAVGAAVVAVGAALRPLRGEERAAAAALAAGAAAYLAHALVDMSWEYLAVSAPLFLVVGLLASAGREPLPARRRGLLPALAAAAIALAALVSLASPQLAGRSVDAALDALARGDARAAVEDAERAQTWNALAVEPLHVEAAAHEFAGRLDEAERLYERAVEVQPDNPASWYELGRFQFEARGNEELALRYADRAWALDPLTPAHGALLNAVRAELERSR